MASHTSTGIGANLMVNFRFDVAACVICLLMGLVKQCHFFYLFKKLITYMCSHKGDMVRQRQSVWIQGEAQLIVRPARYKGKRGKRPETKQVKCIACVALCMKAKAKSNQIKSNQI